MLTYWVHNPTIYQCPRSAGRVLAGPAEPAMLCIGLWVLKRLGYDVADSSELRVWKLEESSTHWVAQLKNSPCYWEVGAAIQKACNHLLLNFVHH